MNETVHKIAEIKKLLDNETFRFISLQTYTGETVTPWNKKPAEVKEKKRDILARLNSQVIPDGIYRVAVRERPAGRLINCYYVQKGEAKAVSESSPNTVIASAPVDTVLSYESALELEKKVMEHKMRADNLQAELDKLKSNDTLEDEEEDFDFIDPISRLVEALLPLGEKYLDIQERKTQLKEQGLYYGNSQSQNGQRSNSEMKKENVKQFGSEQEYLDYIQSLKKEEVFGMYNQLATSGDALGLNFLLAVLEKVRPEEHKIIIESTKNQNKN